MRLQLGLVLGSILGASIPAWADSFPSKAVTIIVPYSAGGGTDSFIRALEKPLEDAFGQDVIVQNIAGGGGAVGLMKALASRSDGYTMSVPTNALFTLQGVNDIGFKTEDFDFIAKLMSEPYVLAAGSETGWNSVDDFVNAAEEGSVTLGFAGVGSSSHIVAMLASEAMGVEPKFVPFDGGSAAVAALLGGHIDAMIASPADISSSLGSGVVGLAATRKTDAIGDTPLFTEAGIDLETTQWRGIAGPKDIPDDAKAAWVAALKKAVQDPLFIEACKNLGFDIDPVFDQELAEFIDATSPSMVEKAQLATE